MIETWAVIQHSKGNNSKSESVAAVAKTEKDTLTSYGDALINGKQKTQ